MCTSIKTHTNHYRSFKTIFIQGNNKLKIFFFFYLYNFFFLFKKQSLVKGKGKTKEGFSIYMLFEKFV